MLTSPNKMISKSSPGLLRSLASRMASALGVIWALPLTLFGIVLALPVLFWRGKVHVRQAACWGILFPIVYLAASAWAMLHGQDAYWHNVFEVAARQAEKHT
jgi:hypothetical protein